VVEAVVVAETIQRRVHELQPTRRAARAVEREPRHHDEHQAEHEPDHDDEDRAERATRLS
jgi:hypothetical protein